MKEDYTQEEKERLVVYENECTGKTYTPREIWQSMNIIPEIYESFCVDAVKNDIAKYVDEYYDEYSDSNEECRVCVKDLRFTRERNGLDSMGFEIIGLLPFNQNISFNKWGSHVSEIEVDQIISCSEYRVDSTTLKTRDQQFATIMNEILG